MAVTDIDRQDWGIDFVIEKDYHRLMSTLKHYVNAAKALCVTRKSRTLFGTKEFLEKPREINRAFYSNVTILNRLNRCKMKEDFDNFRGTRLNEAVRRQNNLKNCQKVGTAQAVEGSSKFGK